MQNTGSFTFPLNGMAVDSSTKEICEMKTILIAILLATLGGCASVTPNRDEAKTRTVNFFLGAADYLLITK